MKELTFYKYTTIGLIVLNISILGCILLIKRPPPPHPKPKNNFQEEMIKVLDLNNKQQSIFRELAKQHKKKIRKINEQQEILLVPFFQNITNPSIELDTVLVLRQFEQIQRQKLALTQRHLISIKELLHEDQLDDYKIFTNRVLEGILAKKKNNIPQPKDF